MPHMIPAYEFRRRARAAMKTAMPILLVVALIAALPSLINSTVTLIADADPNSLMTDFTNRLMQIIEDTSLTDTQVVEAVIGAQEGYFQSLAVFAREKGPLILLMTVLVLVLSPVLTMGMINTLLHALRRQPFTAALALSRVRYILKALGLEMLFALKILLWMLPGLALSLAGLLLPDALAALAMIGGMIAAIIMGVIASYRYALAVFFMADDPTMGIRACIRRSCEVMQRRKMELFSLELSFLGWHLLLSLVQSMLMSFGAVIGLTLGMFASLFLTVYTNCAQAAFYQEYAVGPVEEVAEETGETDDLN